MTLPVSLYLINPRCDVATYFGAEVHAASSFGPAVLLADAALATLAAMAPPDFSVTLCDEHLSPVDLDSTADFIGITGKISQERRMVQLAREFRSRGKTVIMGGCYASLSPHRLRAECDILVQGEIENIAPQFFADLRARQWQREYFGDKPDLRTSPVPRWDLYPNDRALCGVVQTSRGCPFECEFCDVIQYLGRKQRHKSPPQVLAELDELYRRDYRFVFLADDNFTVYRARARELLSAIRDWNDVQSNGRVVFSTQVSIDCARDPELLKLGSEAGLVTCFIGIETPNAASLKETRKRQNIGFDMAERLALFPANGILVTGGMMVGFDSDTTDIFEQQYEFAMSLPVPIFSIHPVYAPETTPLYTRLLAESRVTEHKLEERETLPWATNIVPKQMTKRELVTGMRWLCNRVYRPAAFEYRIARFIDQFEPPAPRRNTGQPGPSRRVDAERVDLARRVHQLGAAEAAMAARIEKRLHRKPAATPWVLMAIGYYMQVRHMYRESGLWNPSLAQQLHPDFASGPDLASAANLPVPAFHAGL